MSDTPPDNEEKPDLGVSPIDPPDPNASTDGDMSLDAALSAAAKKSSKFQNPLKIKWGRDPAKEKRLIQYAFGGMGLLLVILMIYQAQPAKGSMAYGICSTFLELNVDYPHTLRYISLEGSRTAVRIYFTNIDPFGQFKQETIECKFGPDDKMGMRVTEILRNRKPVDSATVDKFNQTLPIIMSNDPYRISPPDWKNQLLKDQ